MKSKLLALDLDSTILNLEEEIEKVFKDNNKTYEPPIDWEFSNYPESIKQQIFNIFKNGKIMCSLKPYDKHVEILNLMKLRGYKIVIITARSNLIRQQTKDYVHKLFGKDVKCYVVKPDESKYDVLKSLNPECWIDDSPQYMLDYQSKGIKCFMISRGNTLYNHHLRDKVEWYEDISFLLEKYK